MELKPGYKQTEVGVIPDDWDVVRLDDCLELLTDFEANGSFADVAKNVRVYDLEKFAWYVRATDLENGSSTSGVKYVDSESYNFLKKTSLYGGEVLVTKRGEIGKVYLFKKKTAHATLAPNLYLLKLNEKALPEYIFLYFKHGNGNRALKINDASTTLGALYKNDVKAISLPLPSFPEQSAIAATLSDVDALITALDRLIAKKRDIKQAAMQELLTGKRRLPGYSGVWEVKSLDQIADIDCDNLSSNTNPDYAFKYISLEDVDNGTLRGFSEQVFHASPSRARRKVRNGDILVSTVRPNLKSHLLFVHESSDWICSTGFSVVRSKDDKATPGYVFFHLFGGDVAKQIEAMLAGSNYPAINTRDVKALQIQIPSSLEEQKGIAAILSDMDAEIAALEAKLVKARQIKQGMMQELLTGRIRLA